MKNLSLGLLGRCTGLSSRRSNFCQKTWCEYLCFYTNITDKVHVSNLYSKIVQILGHKKAEQECSVTRNGVGGIQSNI